jgi:hypothetical protein
MELDKYLTLVSSKIKEAQKNNDVDEAIRLIKVAIDALADIKIKLMKGGA